MLSEAMKPPYHQVLVGTDTHMKRVLDLKLFRASARLSFHRFILVCVSVCMDKDAQRG